MPWKLLRKPEVWIAAGLLAGLYCADAKALDLKQCVVTDGDSIRCGATRLRLAHIDAPEFHQPYGIASRFQLAWIIGDDEFICTDDGLDRYRRTLATCWVRDVEINLFMVWHGHAWAYGRKYLHEQQQARRLKRGLWKSPQPVEPRKWRKEHQ